MNIQKIHIRRTHGKYAAGCQYSVPVEIDEKLARALVKNRRARIVQQVVAQTTEKPTRRRKKAADDD